MSLEIDVMQGVKKVLDQSKLLFEKNLRTAISRNMLTVDHDKIPGICKLMSDTLDQSMSNESDYLVNALAAHNKNK